MCQPLINLTVLTQWVSILRLGVVAGIHLASPPSSPLTFSSADVSAFLLIVCSIFSFVQLIFVSIRPGLFKDTIEAPRECAWTVHNCAWKMKYSYLLHKATEFYSSLFSTSYNPSKIPSILHKVACNNPTQQDIVFQTVANILLNHGIFRVR